MVLDQEPLTEEQKAAFKKAYEEEGLRLSQTKKERLEAPEQEPRISEFGRGAGRIGRSFIQSIGQIGEGLALVAEKMPKELDFLNYIAPEANDRRRQLVSEWGKEFSKGSSVVADFILSQEQAEMEDGFWSRDAPEAVGQGLSMVAGGGAAKALNMGPKVAMAGMAMTQSGTAMYYDVLEETGDESKATIAALGAAGVATTEVLGIGRVFSKINKAAKGAWSRLLWDSATTGLEEGVQEFVQSGAEALVFESMTGKDVDVLSHAFRGGKAGGVAGPIIYLLVGGRRSVRFSQMRDEVKQDLRAGKDVSPDTLAVFPGVLEEAAQEGPLETPVPVKKGTEDVLIQPPEPGVYEAEGKASKVRVEVKEPGLVGKVKEALKGKKAQEAAETPPEGAQTVLPPEETPGVTREETAQEPASARPEQELEKAAQEPLPDETPEKLYSFPGEVGSDIKTGIEALKEKMRLRRKVPEADQLEPKGARMVFTQAVVDRYTLLERTQKAVPPKSDKADPLLKTLLHRGKAATRIEEDQKAYENPILRTAKSAKIEDVPKNPTPEDPGLRQYLTARGAEQRNRTIEFRTEGEKTAGAGMTTEQAQKVLREVQGGAKAESYERIGRVFDQLNKSTREAIVEGGLESRETVRAWEKAFGPHYAPAKTLQDDQFHGYGRGQDIRGQEAKTAFGRESLPDSPLAFAMYEHRRAVYRAEKNKSSQALGRYIEDNAEALAKFAKHVPGVTKKKKLVKGIAVEVADPSVMNRPEVLAYKVDGKTKFIQFEERFIPLAKALKNESPQFMEGLTQTLDQVVKETGSFNPVNLAARAAKGTAQGRPTRFVSGALTRYNPFFIPVNAIRDVGTAFFTSSEHGFKFAARVTAGVPTAYQALLTGKGKMSGYLRRYRAAGAPIAFLDLKGVGTTVQEIQRDLKQAETGTIAELRRGWTNLWGAVSGLNDVAENAARLSAFSNAVEHLGKTDEQAAVFAKELTTNFERKGDLGNMMNTMYMFSTAAMGGIRRGKQALKSRNVKKVIGSAMVGMMLWDQIARALMGEDEYNEIPGYIKRNYFIIPTLDDSRKGKKYISIPMPHFFNFFLSSSMFTSSALSGDMEKGEALGEIAMGAADMLNPFGGAADPVDIATPDLLDPVVQIQLNRDWAGRPLRPNLDPFGKRGTPESEMYWPDANPVAVRASKTLNALSGGTEDKPGVVDIAPSTFEHWLKFWTGGIGQATIRLWGLQEKEDVGPEDLPLTRRFVKETR